VWRPARCGARPWAQAERNACLCCVFNQAICLSGLKRRWRRAPLRGPGRHPSRGAVVRSASHWQSRHAWLREPMLFSVSYISVVRARGPRECREQRSLRCCERGFSAPAAIVGCGKRTSLARAARAGHETAVTHSVVSGFESSVHGEEMRI
jgi:hypothetical protein